MRMPAMALQRRTIVATALVVVAAMMQGCNDTVRPTDVNGISQLNNSWRVRGAEGYESASDFCKLDWSYSDTAAWNDIPGSQCGHEGDQSPIHIETKHILDNTSETGEFKLGPPQWIHGDPKLGVVQGQGKHEWTFDIIGGEAGITHQGKNYSLTNFHLHTPSEHTMDFDDGNGPQRYPAEMHFVNTAADGQILVVALFYTINKPDEELARLVYDVGAFHQGDIPINNTDKQIINNPYEWPLTQYNIETYYTYTGSLTTPPCSTDVTWMIFKQTRMMDDYQLSQFRGALQAASCDSLPSSDQWVTELNDKGTPPSTNANSSNIGDDQSWMPIAKWNISVNAGENIRPLQPLGNRKVSMYVTPTPNSLQIIETIFVITVTWMLISIYNDRILKKGVRDCEQRDWLNTCNLPLPADLAERLVVVDARNARNAAVAAQPAAPAGVQAREPTAASNVIVAPSDDGPSYQRLQG